MKAYLKLVDFPKAKEQVWEILKLEQLIDWKSKIEVNSKLVKKELEYLLDIDSIEQLQKQLLKKRRNKLSTKVNLQLLVSKRYKYKQLNILLEDYRKFLKLVFISQLDGEVLFKWLDKNEFHPMLDIDANILTLIIDWKLTNNIKSLDRDGFYYKNIAKLRNIMHEFDN